MRSCRERNRQSDNPGEFYSILVLAQDQNVGSRAKFWAAAPGCDVGSGFTSRQGIVQNLQAASESATPIWQQGCTRILKAKAISYI